MSQLTTYVQPQINPLLFEKSEKNLLEMINIENEEHIYAILTGNNSNQEQIDYIDKYGVRVVWTKVEIANDILDELTDYDKEQIFLVGGSEEKAA